MQEQQSEKRIIVCPIENTKIISPCNVSTCMWNKRGECLYNPNTKEIIFAESKGISIKAALNEIRSAKSKITKIIILEKYIEWLKKEKRIKKKLSQSLSENEYIVSAFNESYLTDAVFGGVSYSQFCEACRVKNFDKFLSENKGIGKISLPATIFIREKKLQKIREIYKNTKIGKSTKSKNQEAKHNNT